MKYDEAFFFLKKYDGLSQINSHRLKNHDDKHIFGGHHFAFQPRGDDPQNHLLAIMAVVCFFSGNNLLVFDGEKSHPFNPIYITRHWGWVLVAVFQLGKHLPFWHPNATSYN